MASKDTKTKVANAFKAMKALGFAQDKVKPVLKNLFMLYDKNWALIEEENYRALADAMFDRYESEAEYFFDEETLIDEELERPLKRLHCTDSDGPNSSYGATSMLETPLIKPNDEINVMHEVPLVYQNVVEPRQTNGEIYTGQCSSKGKGKQVVSPRTSTPMENHDDFHPSGLSKDQQCFPSRMDPRLSSHTLTQIERGSKSAPSQALVMEKRTDHGNSSCHKEPKMEPVTNFSPKEKNDGCVGLVNPNMDHHQHSCDSTKSTLLHRQDQHISKKILSGESSKLIHFKDGDYYLSKLRRLDDKVVAYLINWGFYGVLKTIRIKLDSHLLTAMVERWRPETHTFFLPVGEATVTLQDVSVIWGLPVHGKIIIGTRATRTRDQWIELCNDKFGWAAKHEDIIHSYFRIRSLGKYLLERSMKTFESDLDAIRFTRAVALMIVVTIFFPNTYVDLAKLKLLDLFASDEEVMTFNWGSAVLANLYRELCKGSTGGVNLCGAFRLVQLWAWTRIPSFTPILKLRFSEDTYDHRCYQFFGWRRFAGQMKRTNTVHNNLRVCRDALDAIGRREFMWTPYDVADLERVDPETIVAWKYKGPLIFFGIVVPHHPDRVSRQFGLPPNIPEPPESADVLKDLHSYNPEIEQDWNVIHARWIHMSDHLHEHIWDDSAMVSEETYYAWYMTHEVIHLVVRLDKEFGWRGDTVKSMAHVTTKNHEVVGSHLQGQSETYERRRDYGCQPSPHDKSSRKSFHPPPDSVFHTVPKYPAKPQRSSYPPTYPPMGSFYPPAPPKSQRSSYPPPCPPMRSFYPPAPSKLERSSYPPSCPPRGSFYPPAPSKPKGSFYPPVPPKPEGSSYPPMCPPMRSFYPSAPPKPEGSSYQKPCPPMGSLYPSIPPKPEGSSYPPPFYPLPPYPWYHYGYPYPPSYDDPRYASVDPHYYLYPSPYVTPEHMRSSYPPPVYPHSYPYPPPYHAPGPMESSYPPPLYPYWYPYPPPYVAPRHTPRKPPRTSRAHRNPHKSLSIELSADLSGYSGDDSGDT